MARLLFRNVEYIILRLIRRFLFPKALLGLARYVPYYRMNLSETQPENTCALYTRWLELAGQHVDDRQILEVGSGATNAAGYALVCAGAKCVWCLEPFIPFDEAQDAALCSRVGEQFGKAATQVSRAVRRCVSFDSISPGSADLILSHSVLEHVDELQALFARMKTVLAPRGAMLHIVDYRDHFFKYPLHFLQFTRRHWQTFLNPGDLPRWRLSDHRAALERAGFDVQVMHREQDPGEFERIKPHISADFDLADPELGVLQAVLYCVHRPKQSE
jgi:SAM-dependent methyltransferase